MPVAEVKEWKRDEIGEFAELIDSHSVVAVVNLKNLPAPQLQEMRAELRDRMTLRMTKKTLMQLAFDEADKDVSGLQEHLTGMPALLFTEENPFKLFQTLQKETSKAPIKPGQEAPHDIIIPEGPTGFDPGPIIGELGNAGIPAGVEDGEVAVQQDTTVAEQGETVDASMANILGQLGIKPMEVGLNLVAAYQDGEVFTKDVLDIDVDSYRDDFTTAASHAHNLAVNAAYPARGVTETLLANAHADANALAQSQDIITPETITSMLATADQHAQALDSRR